MEWLAIVFVVLAIAGYVSAKIAYISLNYNFNYQRYEKWKTASIVIYIACVVVFLILFFGVVFWHYDTIWRYPK